MKVWLAMGIALLCGGATPGPPLFLKSYGEVWPNYAVKEFCRLFSHECRKIGPDGPIELTPLRRTEIEEVNARINREMRYATDDLLYRKGDRWISGTTHGDCEDFAIKKRATLIATGWPSSALLLTVVRTPQKEMHAVLIARTTDGDLILDKTAAEYDPVRPWHRTRYEYVSQQSPEDPERWFSLFPRPALNDMQLRWWTAGR